MGKRLLSAIDYITIGYASWILLYMSLGFNRAVEPMMHLPVYAAIITVILLLAHWDRNCQSPRLKRLLNFVRSIYPVMLFGYFFISLQAVNRIIFPQWLDPFFARIDYSIFGYYPSLEWGRTFGTPWISELYHFAYFCYYPMIGGLPLYFYFKDKKVFGEIIFTLAFVFYSCYFLFSILPVIGGRYFPEAMALTKVYQGGPFTHIMALIYNLSTHLGGAFPSSHVAIAITLTISALRHTKVWGMVFLYITMFLAIATVYCHYHWFIDMVAGVFAGIGGYYLALWAYRKLETT